MYKRKLRKLMALIFTLALVMSLIPQMAMDTEAASATDPAANGANGSVLRPYIIDEPDDLMWLADQVNSGTMEAGKYFMQTVGIDLSGYSWTPIGTATKGFNGYYNGNGYTISNLTCTSTADNVGFFGYVNGGSIENLTLSAITVTCTADASGSPKAVGALAGSCYATVTNCHVTGTSVITSNVAYTTSLGGLVGSTGLVSVTGCSSSAAVSSSHAYTTLGGIIGSSSGDIENCCFSGSISNTAGTAVNGTGGIAGYINNKSVKNCLSIGSISSNSPLLGAIVGNAYDTSSGYLNTTDNNYYLAGTAANGYGKYYLTDAADNTGTTALIAAQLTDSGSYPSTWFSSAIWKIDSGSPYLNKIGTVTTPGSDTSDLTNIQINATVTGDGGDTISARGVEYYNVGDTSYTRVPSGSGGTGSYTVTLSGMAEGIYFMRAYATNGVGTTYSDGINIVYTPDGSGTIGDPYIIDSADDLNFVRCDTDAYYTLVCDLDLSATAFASWKPIGSSATPFIGSFDGGGHIISGYTAVAYEDNSGLFGNIGTGGTVTKLGVNGAYAGGYCVGGIAACNSGTISQCFNSADISSAIDYTGIGGIAGYNTGTIENCYNTGNISGNTSNSPYAGGISGYDDSPAKIINCYNTGNIYVGATGYASGITPYPQTVTGCFNAGSSTISGADDTAFLAGVAYNGTLTNCDFLAQTGLTIDGKGGSTGQTAPNYFTVSSDGTAYDNFYTTAGWDFAGAWRFLNGSYPDLQAFPAPYSAALSTGESLMESNIAGGSITVTLSGTTFNTPLAVADFSLNNAPAGVTISSVNRTGDAACTLMLAYTGADFDDNKSMSVTIKASGVACASDITSDTLTVAAVVEPAPTVTGIDPSYDLVAGGAGITITGTNFAGTPTVTIGGAAATEIVVVNDTTITVTAPAGTVGAKDVAVTTRGGTATGTGLFTYYDVPVVTGISPSSGLNTGGTDVTITGTSFAGTPTVTIGGGSATGITVVNSTTITATTPTGTAGPADVTVTTPGGSGTGTGLYTYTAAPTAATNAAGNISSTGATLNGTVNAMYAATTVTFEYGPDAGYGSTASAEPSTATGGGDTSVSKAISGLTPNTTYHYRVVGVNAQGTTHGLDGTFATLQVAAAPTGSAATNIDGTIKKDAAITLTSEENATIYYTTALNAAAPSEPDLTSPSVLNGGELTLPLGLTYGDVLKIKAFAAVAGKDDSTAVEISYNVQSKTELVLTGIIPSDKEYDGNADAAADFSGADISGKVGADDVSLSGTPSFSFDSAAAGNAKTVTVSGYSLAGADAEYYTLKTQLTATANIIKKALTPGTIVIADKQYDGTGTATIVSIPIISGIVGSDIVSVNVSSVSAAFDAGSGIGNGKAVTVSGIQLTGADSDNYSIAETAYATGNITARIVSVDSITIADKAYDGNTAATITGAALTGKVGTEDVNIDYITTPASAAFEDSLVGNGKTVTVTGLILGGGDKANYVLESGSYTTTGNIIGLGTIAVPTASIEGITVKSGTTVTLTTVGYDGTTLYYTVGLAPADPTSSDASIANGGTVAITGNPGDAVILKVYGAKAGYADSAVAALHYTIQPKSTLAITGASTGSKDYDGTRDAVVSGGTLSGSITGGDDVTLDSSAAAGQFSDKNAENAKTVQASGYALTGNDAMYYDLIQPTLTADIRIRNITVSGISISDKVYDGTTTADISDITLSWKAAGDEVYVRIPAATAVFEDESVGNGKNVSISGLELAGADAVNYQLTSTTASATGNIVPAGSAETPEASPSEGSILSGTSITLTTATSGATIYYALDGNAPSIYTGPVILTGDPGEVITLEATAQKTGMTDSGTLTKLYTIAEPGSLILNCTPGDRIVTLSWNEIPSTVTYEVYKEDSYIGSGIFIADGLYGYDATGLDNGKLYNFTVNALDTEHRITNSAHTSATPRTVPGKPTGVTAEAGNGKATVSFTAPSSDGGSEITKYTVTSSPGGITAEGAGSPITVTGLTNGIEYTFTVKAFNSAGYGPDSSASAAVTPFGPSADNSLTSVLGQPINAGTEAGTSGEPKTAGINVGNAVAAVTSGDIVKHDAGAIVTFYGTDSSFKIPDGGSVNLAAGGATDIYIKVVAADSTAMYYKVTINRAAPLSSDAGLTSVAAKTDSTPGLQSGADAANAITWEVSVDNAKAALSLNDIEAAANATVRLYSDSAYTMSVTSKDTLPLVAGGTTAAYIKVTAQNGTTVKYYNVAITRALPVYTVTYKNNYNDTDATVYKTQEVSEGSKATVPAQPTRSGYTFGGWYMETVCTTAWNFKNNSVMNDTILYAKWVAVPIPTYTVMYFGNGATSGSVPVDNNAYISGALVKVKANTGSLAKTGYVFNGWNSLGTTYTAGQAFTLTGNVNLTAIWKAVPATYTATYNNNFADGGTYISQAGIVSGSILTAPPEPSRSGYLFVGWYKDAACVNPWRFSTDTVMADMNLYAKWAASTYTVSGTVVDDGAVPAVVSGAAVKVVQGNVQFGGTATTSNSGSFTITGVPDGTYNLIITKDDQEVTVCITISGSNYTYTGSITLPSGNKNSRLDVIGSETPNVVVDNLNNVFEDPDVYDSSDENTVSDGGTVEIRLIVQKNEDSTDKAVVEAAMSSAGYTSGTVLDVDMTKISTTSSGVTEESAITAVSSLIKLIIPLPAELQGKSSYVIYRAHDYGSGVVVDAITTTANGGEYIEISSDKTQITAYLKYFSTYAIAYVNSTNSESSSHSGSSGTKKNDAKKYVIVSTAGTGGSINPSGNKTVTEGESIIYTITADKGYYISDVLVDGKSVGALSSYTFSSLSSSHTIKAEFAEVTGLPYFIDDKGSKVFIGFASKVNGMMKYIAPKGKTVLFKENPKSFMDISEHWARKYIDFVTEREIFTGTGSNAFSPDAGMTRAMFASVIGRLYERSYGQLTATGAEKKFTDVDYDAYYGVYVDWAAGSGIITGADDGRFEPGREITREEMAVILYRFAGFLKAPAAEPEASQQNYTDASAISTWAAEAAGYCRQTGIISGREGGSFVPQGTATRAEVAAILQRFIERIVE